MKSHSTVLWGFVFALCLRFFVGFYQALAAQPAAPTVGIEGQVIIPLPGTALKTVPTDPKAAVTVRIADAQRRGTLTQYDLRYIGQVPGNYDLRKYLARDDGSTTDDLPPIEVRVTGLLPADHKGELALREEQRLPFLGSYHWLMLGLGIVWLGLLIPFWLTRTKSVAASGNESAAPLTTADRLRPLIAHATSGAISADEKALLERLLLSHWRERLALTELEPSDAMARLRAHVEAGALLRTLEDWLHRPPGSASFDLERMLAPYAQPTPTAAAPQAASSAA
jgi:hypothetical protein